MAIDKIIEGAGRRVMNAIDTDKPDVSALRRELDHRIDFCLLALKDGRAENTWLTDADTDTVAFSPTTVDGHPILMNGKSTTFWPRADVVETVQAFRAALARGEFDDQLVCSGLPTITPKIQGEKLPADSANGSMSTGGGRTDEDEVAERFTEQLGSETL